MVKHIITEISESDFRKLKLFGYEEERVSKGEGRSAIEFVKKDLNQKLTDNIEYLIKMGYEEDLECLKLPITVAIHESNKTFNPAKPYDCGFYWDKYMNIYRGASTYHIAVGIKHLYSTRDYYEDHEDYWKVRKDETQVIYRITIDEKWLKKFVLKHKTVKIKTDTPNVEIHEHYDLVDGDWKLTNKTKVTYNKYSTRNEPYKD